MNPEDLAFIKQECEKIEKYPGFGKVVISIDHGCVRVVQPMPTIILRGLDKVLKRD